MFKKIKSYICDKIAYRRSVKETYAEENAMFGIEKNSQSLKPVVDDFCVVMRAGGFFFVICVVLRVISLML